MLITLLAHAILGCALVSDADLAARLDLDGDGVARPNDCDDNDATVGAAAPLYVDADGDGVGSDASAAACQSAAGFVDKPGDCDDTRADVYPEAEEVCDGVDNDCDASVDENGGSEVPTWYLDADGDEYGVTTETIDSCAQPLGYAALPGDCDDGDATVNPRVREVCDGRDEDCSGTIDDPYWWLDEDADSYGLDADALISCEPLSGRAPAGGDCNDRDASVNPGAEELCDAADVDEDCDGLADDADDDAVGAAPAYLDTDGDGHGDPSGSVPAACELTPGYSWLDDDCDDARADVSPDATEVCYDGLDQDCDGVNDYDCDEDGSARDDDCDDADPYVSPLMIEACGDEVDNDCDGEKAGGCRLHGEVALESADATIAGQDSFDEAGFQVAGVGDLDADGYDDFVVTSQAAGTSSGRSVIFHGPVSGDVSWNDEGDSVTGCAEYDNSARQVAGGSDLDGDGRDDWITGAAYAAGATGDGGGVVYVLGDGPLSLCDATTYVYGEAGDGFGFAIDAGADFTGDGRDDLVASHIGRDEYDEFGSATVYGIISVVPGPITGAVSATDAATLVVENDLNTQPFGYYTEFVGDLDGDGLDELAIGQPYASITSSYDGAVFLLAGGTSGAIGLGEVDATLHGSDSSHRAWWGFAAGDLDGDGRDDLGVSSQSWNDDLGAVFVFSTLPTGTVSLLDADASIENRGLSYYLGSSVDAGADVNGDGRDDLLLLSPNDYRTGFSNGAALLYFGPVLGTSDETDADCALYDYYGNWSSSAMQGDAAFIGDTNADGFDDLLVSDAGDDEAVPYGGVAWLFLGGE